MTEVGDGSTAAPKRFRIYTRTGDGGTSTLYTGQRLPKDCAYFAALGDVDELNSAVGLAREFVREAGDDSLAAQLGTLQSRLIDVGAAVATPSNAEQVAKVSRTRFDARHITTLESWIDAMDDTLPPLRHFILPSGGRAGAALHMARSVCRRAERSVVALARSGQEAVDEAVHDAAVRRAAGDAATPAVTAEASAASTATTGTTSGTTAAAVDSGAQPTQQPQAGGAGSTVAGRQYDGTLKAVPEDDESEVVDPKAIIFLNRLSDYLFTAARYTAAKGGHPETTYQKQA